MIDAYAKRLEVSRDAFTTVQALDLKRIASRVRIFCIEGRKTRAPEPNELPWTVLVLLSAYSRKFIPVKGTLPKLSDLSKQLRCVRGTIVKKLNEIANTRGAHERFADEVVSNVLGRAKRELSACKGRSCLWKNIADWYHHAMSWISRSSYAIVPTDKEGTFGLVKFEDFRKLLAEKLCSPMYEEIDMETEVRAEALTMLARLAKRFDKASSHTIVSSLRCHFTSVISRIGCTLKSHKQDGEVCLRILHLSSKHPFSGAGKVINSILNPFLKDYSHLCGSSQAMIENLKKGDVLNGSEYNANDIIVKADVSDFYMAAPHKVIMAHAFTNLGLKNDVKEAYDDLLAHLLFFQFVRNPLDGRVYRVLTGSGMGLNYSGSLSDKVYLEKVERRWCLSASVRKSFQVRSYSRYRDDSITILGTSGVEIGLDVTPYNSSSALFGARRRWAKLNNAEKWMWGIHRSSYKVWKVKVEELALQRMRILDFFVNVNQNRITISPYIKLCDRPYIRSTSGQPQHVHRSWPVANALRVANLCDDDKEFQAASKLILARYRASDINSAALLKVTDLQKTSKPPEVNFAGHKIEAKKASPAVDLTVWGVLQHHPVWERCRFTNVIADTIARWQGHIPRLALRFAYKNLGRPMINNVQNWLNGGDRGR